MSGEDVRALVGYRLEQAGEALRDSELLLATESLRAAVNRAYYAMFYAVLALLVAQGSGTSKHSGAIGLFDQLFVKEGIFDRDLSAWLHDAFELRQRADYREMFTPSRERAEKVLAHSRAFVARLKAYLASRGLYSEPT